MAWPQAAMFSKAQNPISDRRSVVALTWVLRSYPLAGGVRASRTPLSAVGQRLQLPYPPSSSSTSITTALNSLLIRNHERQDRFSAALPGPEARNVSVTPQPPTTNSNCFR